MMLAGFTWRLRSLPVSSLQITCVMPAYLVGHLVEFFPNFLAHLVREAVLVLHFLDARLERLADDREPE